MQPTESLYSRSARAATGETGVQLSAASQSVEVLALTTDHELLGTLRASVNAEQRRVWHAPGFQEAAELIMAGRVGVALIDTAATGADTGSLCERFRSQFPDLVLIVAGTVQDQNRLVAQITSGDIYRFLHKPISEARAHQFIETSVRRHLDGRGGAAADTGSPLKLPGKRVMGLAAAAVALVLGVIVWAMNRGGAPEVVQEQTADGTVPTLELARQTTADDRTIDRAAERAAERAIINRATSMAGNGSTSGVTTKQPARTASNAAQLKGAASSSSTKIVPAASTLPTASGAKTSSSAASTANEPKNTQTSPAAIAAAVEPTTQTAPAVVAPTESKQTAPAETAVVAAAPATVEIAPAAPIAKAPEPAQQTKVAAAAAPALSSQEAFLANIVAVGTNLPRTKQIDPMYPYRARRDNVEGSVELDFTVDTRGGVKDILVHQATPQGVFDKAATDALAQWKFKPVMREGRAVEQRARVKLRFQMEK